MVSIMIISGIALILALVCLFILIGQRNFFKNFSDLEKKLEGIAKELEAKKIIEQVNELRKKTESIDRKVNQNIKRISEFVTINKAIVHSLVGETENFLRNIRKIASGKYLLAKVPSEEEKKEAITEAEKTEASQEEKSSVDAGSSDGGVFDRRT